LIKRFAADHGDESWKKMARRMPETGKKVAVVGAGPAGLTVAYYLAKLGHKVTVFESQPKPGGMMLLGIPEYRLPRDVIDNEIKEITNVGVEIKTGTPIKSIDPLFEQGYLALFLGLSAHQGMKLGVRGENLPGVMESVEFLRRGNLGEKVRVDDASGLLVAAMIAIDAPHVPAVWRKKSHHVLPPYPC
jgi:NADPH-dependent glutamate synthase beta subunit-like oxidoreductase